MEVSRDREMCKWYLAELMELLTNVSTMSELSGISTVQSPQAPARKIFQGFRFQKHRLYSTYTIELAPLQTILKILYYMRSQNEVNF